MQNGAPLLPSWRAFFECESYARYDGGDHEIFVGRVTRFDRRASATRPLIFYNGKYRSLNSEETVTTPPDANAWLLGW
jgi:flavin reductase (DIM6/NTAB) family NADH-FMN oxidoreductase RutF